MKEGPIKTTSAASKSGTTGQMLVANSRGPEDPYTEVRIDLTDLSERDTETRQGTNPFSYSSYQVFPNVTGMYKRFPYRMVGKVFFTIPGDGDYVCSGAVVSTPNQSVVWTAGHCVYSPDVGAGTWHTNFVFVPGRHDGGNPLQTWSADTLGTLTGWTNGLYEYDHGGAFMNLGGPGGNNLVGQLGSLGFLANAPRQQHWHVSGYPAEAPFDGEHHHTCASSWAANDQPTGTPGTDPKTIGVGCDMNGGVSGGPWIVDFCGISGSSNLLNGNASYRYTGVQDELYGPYFGDGAINLRDYLGDL